MKTLIYISEYIEKSSAELQQHDLDNIIQQALKNNKEYQITGALLFHNNHFLQLLEGDAENVDFIFEKIRKDPRHHKIEVIFNDAVEKRAFPNWEMRFFNLSDPAKFSRPVLKKIQEIYMHNFQFNSVDFIYLLESVINDPDFLKEL